jgi:hypothetical protein
MSEHSLRHHPLVVRVLATAGAAVAMIAVGQLAGMATGQCTILCRPGFAGLLGAVIGFAATASMPARRG